jgi:hypothetical protein
MTTQPWIDPRVQSVRVADLCAYFLAHGWKLKPFPRPQVLLFEGPPDDNGQPIVQAIPASEDLRDYRMAVEDVIGALSVLEDRSATAILEDILRNRAQEKASQSNGEPPTKG